MAEYSIKGTLETVSEYIGEKVKDALDEKENIFRVDAMPVASDDNEGQIVQFIGTTTVNYTHGYYYECQEVPESDPVAYQWVNIKIQDDVDISGKEDKFRFSTMPTASADWLGKTVEYTGSTTGTYTHSKRYACQVVSGSDPVTYEWVLEAEGVQDSRISEEVVKIGVRIDDGYRPYIIFNPVDVIEPFANMSVADILYVASMYYSGDISIADIQTVWSVGDTKTISLSAVDGISAQDVTLIVVDFAHDILSTEETYEVGKEPKAFMTLGFMLSEEKGWTGTYSTSSLRTWVNETLINALPAEWRSGIKAVDKSVDDGWSGNSPLSTTVESKLFIPSVWDFMGRAPTAAELGNARSVQGATGGGTRYVWHTNHTRSKTILTASSCRYNQADNKVTIIFGGTQEEDAISYGNTSGIMPHFCI